MDSKLPIDIFENVMQLAIEGCKAVATYIREACLSIAETLFPLTVLSLHLIGSITRLVLGIISQVLLENTKQLEYHRGA